MVASVKGKQMQDVLSALGIRTYLRGGIADNGADYEEDCVKIRTYLRGGIAYPAEWSLDYR